MYLCTVKSNKSNFIFIVMEQNAIKNLQSQLYIEELRLKYAHKNFWFTKQVEQEWKRYCISISKKVIECTNVEDYNKQSLRKLYIDYFHDFRNELHNKDFVLGLLYSYCLHKYANNGKSYLEQNETSIMNKRLNIDFERLTDISVLDCYKAIDVHVSNELKTIEFDAIVKNFVAIEDRDDRILEIGTSFFDCSDKIVDCAYNYATRCCVNFLTKKSSDISLLEDVSFDSIQKKYSFIIVEDSVLLTHKKDISAFQELINILGGLGKLIVVSPLLLINSNKLKEFRRWIIDNDLLRLYLSPDDRETFYGPSWCVISPEKTGSSDIHFVINYQHNRFDGGYLSSHKQLSQALLQNLDYDFEKVGNYTESSKIGKAVAFSKLFTIEKKLVDCKDIEGFVFDMKKPTDIFSFVRQPNSFSKRVMRDDMYKVCKPAVVASMTNSGEWIFTHILASDKEPIFVSSSEVVLYCEESIIMPEYVYIMQNQGIFQKMFEESHIQAECFNTVYYEPDVESYPKDWMCNFTDCILTVPAIDEQILQISTARLLQEASVQKVNSLELMIEKKKTEYIDEVRSRKHDMMPYLRQLDCSRKIIEAYLQNFGVVTDEALVVEIKKRLKHQEEAIQSLYASLEFFSRESRFGQPEVINLDEYLLSNFRDGEIDGISYTIDYDTDEEALKKYGFDVQEHPLWNSELSVDDLLAQMPDYIEGVNVYIAKDDLHRLCDNIIHNAIVHGFTDPERRDYNITTELSVDFERNMFQIDFTNNGNPFPKGMDKEHYGIRGVKAGPYSGSGEGGYIVRAIVEHYDGDFDIFSRIDEGVSINTVRIYLPIYKDGN